jgi:single-strand DNA-binding protein
MASLNKVFLAGNLTRAPELRYTPGGTAVAQFGVAVNRKFKNREGQVQEEATFVDVEVWGRQAETASEYLAKGSPVLIEGRLKLDSWESKQTGEKRSKLRVVGERVQFLGGRRDKSTSESTRSSKPMDVPDIGPIDELPPDDEVPF